jgi:Tol biopolymer transport system component
VITAKLGSGGMGEVYRASDTTLGRDVAIKVLPDAFAKDDERVARFKREARALASLNHPNIAQIYGVEDADGVPALIMELVDGPTIADRLATRPVPVADALVIAHQLADGLDAAHSNGIVHRDLKPANLKVAADGRLKILDFGIAKAMTEDRSADDLTHSSTTGVSATRLGVVLGTPRYMSPEQVRGLPVDKRSDIWAFGCVLWEMLTGRTPFEGETLADTLTGIIEREPEWRALPESTPSKVRDLLRRCLQKDRRRRLHDIADARIDLEDAQEEPAAATGGIVTALPRVKWILWSAAAALLALLAVSAVIVWKRSEPVGPETRLDVATPETTDPISLSVSADGRAIAFVATDAGHPRLWVRRLDSVSPRALPGTDGAYYPFWSPDNRSVGFFADGKLKRIDLDTASVQVLADASAGRGGTWNSDGVILYAPQAGPLFSLPASGGERRQVSRIDAQRMSHRFPQFLPDGRHFLYLVRSAAGAREMRGLYIGDLQSTETQRIVDSDVAGVLVGTDRLLFVRQGTLFAQSFDMRRMTLGGDAWPVASQIVHNAAIGAAAVSSSPGGVLIYRAGPAERRQLTWFNRLGQTVGTVGEPDTGDPSDPAISPDGRIVAVSREVDENRDIWLIDTARGARRRLTFDVGIDRSAVWSPDSTRLVFTGSSAGSRDFLQRRVDGGAEATVLLSAPGAAQTADFSPDGRFLVFRNQDVKTRYDIWAVRMTQRPSGDLEVAEGQRPFVVVQTASDERDPQFSPDGRWIAYESDESGRFEVYVQPFPGPGPKWAVSKNGGAQVRWPRQGHELVYIALDNRLMSVTVALDAERQRVKIDDPVPLFITNVGGAVTVRRQQYVVSADGRRFLMNAITEQPGSSPITLVQNLRRQAN